MQVDGGYQELTYDHCPQGVHGLSAYAPWVYIDWSGLRLVVESVRKCSGSLLSLGELRESVVSEM